MKEFRTSLLREKFTITEKENDEGPITALSNRIVVPLVSVDGIDNETFVIRTQNMHSCARLAAAVIKEFIERGTIASRASPVPWKEIWGEVIKGYERDWNPDIWCAVYHRGRVIYKHGERHPFIDIIEQCDSANEGEYAKSVIFAEKAFSQAGKKITIDHKSNVALVISCKEEQAKCGIIVRAANGTTTFNYTAASNEENPIPIRIPTTLTVAAAFLEAVQLAFQAGMLNKRLKLKLFSRGSEEERKHKRVIARLGNLNRAITDYEKNFHVTYRPERPSLKSMVDRAEEFTAKNLQPEIKSKIADDKLNPEDWVV